MTAFVLLGVITSGVLTGQRDPAREKQYVVHVVILQGDPLGTTEAGTVEFLSRPTLMLTGGQTGYFQVGGPGEGLVLKTAVYSRVAGGVRAVFDYSRKSTGPGEAAKHDCVIEFDKPTTFRLGAESPTNQTWMIVTVYPKPFGDLKAIAEALKGPTTHQFAGPRR